MDSEIVGSVDMADITVDASFSWTVDSAIRSEAASDFGASPAHSFASEVDWAIRSSSASGADLVASPVHVTARLFSIVELKAATNNFSLHNKIGGGRFGFVYRGKLVDGREVAIKRKETFGMSKFAILSRLYHANLVGLVGYSSKEDERLSVCEYMKNGSLYDHLHHKNGVGKGSSVFNYWKMRIKIALDASQGIEYLHNYVVPYIIHRDIKSANILLDAIWTARISDFALSLICPEPDGEYDEMEMGSLGYVDPEYYRRGMVTAKSDVYGFGIVLLELLTGKSALFKSVEDGGIALSVIDFAVPAILAGELTKILDPRVGPPNVHEEEALELVASIAVCCVKLEGKDRPTMTKIVVNLKRALGTCGRSPSDCISDFSE